MSFVTVYGFGLCSTFGGFSDSCAAARAGLSRFSDHEHISMMFPGEDEATPLTIARAASVYVGYQGVARRVKLLVSAYQDLLSQVSVDQLPENTHILFATPDPEDRYIDETYTEEFTRSERLSSYADKILKPFFAHTNPRLSELPIQMIFGERIAFARVVKKAQALVVEGGACLILTVDTLLDEVMLDTLSHTERLKSADQPTGFVPGEGAACLFLGPESEAAGVNIQLAAVFEDSSALSESRVEDGSEDVEFEGPLIRHEDWTAERLYAQVQRLITTQNDGARYPVLLSDVNGEECRAMEYGLLQVLLKRDFGVEKITEMQLPATVFGETAGMSGVYAMAMTIAAAQRGYLFGLQHQILLSEFGGRRGVIQINVSIGG